MTLFILRLLQDDGKYAIAGTEGPDGTSIQEAFTQAAMHLPEGMTLQRITNPETNEQWPPDEASIDYCFANLFSYCHEDTGAGYEFCVDGSAGQFLTSFENFLKFHPKLGS